MNKSSRNKRNPCANEEVLLDPSNEHKKKLLQWRASLEITRLSEKFEPVDEQVSRNGDFAKRCAPPEVRCLAGGRSQTLRRRVDLAPGNRFQGSLLWSAPRRPARALGDLGERDFFR
jgi:hypothetical protein